MPVGIEAWITQIPPITRAWLALSVLTSVAVVSASAGPRVLSVRSNADPPLPRSNASW